MHVLHKIDHISRVRFSLTVVAKYIHKLLGTSQKLMSDPISKRLFDAAAKLCQECKSPWPRYIILLCDIISSWNYHFCVYSSLNFLAFDIFRYTINCKCFGKTYCFRLYAEHLLKGNSLKLCMLAWRITYRHNNLIRPFLQELPFLTSGRRWGWRRRHMS